MNYQFCADAVLNELTDCLTSLDAGQIPALVEAIATAPRIFCDGKGRSGLLAQAFAMRLAQMGLTAYAADGVTTPAIGSGDLLIIASGSGRTPSLVGHCKKAVQQGAHVALITSSDGSPVQDCSELCVHFHAEAKQSRERRSIQPMGTLFEQSLMLFFDVTVLLLMDRLGIDNDEMYRLHNNLE